MFFDNWQPLLRMLVVGVLAYINLIVLLRISGRRTLSKMNAFDLVVTVALGSTFATILLNKNVSLAQGTLALALLIGLQYLVTWARQVGQAADHGRAGAAVLPGPLFKQRNARRAGHRG